jgi:hypothetical protein
MPNTINVTKNNKSSRIEFVFEFEFEFEFVFILMPDSCGFSEFIVSVSEILSEFLSGGCSEK